VIFFGFIEEGRIAHCGRCPPGDTYETALAKTVEFLRNEREDAGMVFCGQWDGSEFERFSVMGRDGGKVASPAEIRRYCELAAVSVLYGSEAA
jgi:hypothetical protein